MGNAGNLVDGVEQELVAADANTIVVELQDLISENAIVDLRFVAVEQEAIFLARKVIAPQTAFVADDEIGIVAMPRPIEWSRPIQFHPLFSEGDLSAFEHDPQNHVTECGRERGTNQRSQPRVRAHQLGDDKTRDNSRDRHDNGDLVGNNKVFEIDEGGDEQDRKENPRGDRDLPRKNSPDGEKQKRGQQFDAKITKGNPGAAVCTTATEQQPTHQWNVLSPRNLCFAGRAKGTTRLFDRDIARQAINADVQKRTDGRAGNKGETCKQRVIKSNFHAIR